MDLQYIYNEFKLSNGISTDTRKLRENQIFFALRGPNFNANALASEAIARGARLAVIDDPEYVSDQNTILVKDSLKTLQNLAIHHRKNLKIPLFGLTGSNGKTTTKQLLKAVLEKKYKTYATEGNLNNHIGVPLTILSIDDSHQMAVVEMGANHVGEIAMLSSISQPTHGLITNIGKAHIGEFGGFENIIRGKSELYDYLKKTNGKVFINQQDPVLKNMSRRFDDPVLYPSSRPCKYELISQDPTLVIAVNDRKVKTSLVGSYNFINVAAALCVGNYFDVPEEDAIDAIKEYQSDNNRSQIIETRNNRILLDAYNANPTSMELAIRNFQEMKAGSKRVILGDMLELGDASEEEHFFVGRLLRKHGVPAIFVGPLMQSALKAYPEALHFEDKAQLIAYLKKYPVSGEFILIKGSRGSALEEVVDYL